MPHNPIRIGIIGAGLFARENHIPALLNLSSQFQIAAICTNTPESAAKAQAILPKPVEVYYSMEDLVQQEDIEAVDILLPIDMLPGAVEVSLVAGKHVIGEKPVAPTVDIAKNLLNIHARHSTQIWMVAENFRSAQSGAIAHPHTLVGG